MNIGVFASGRGSNFQAIINAIKNGDLPAQVTIVISNNSKAGVLEIAQRNNIPNRHISERQFGSEKEFCSALLNILHQYRVDLIALAGYMKKIPVDIIQAYRGRIVNIHPGLLPEFGGEKMYGHFVHEAVIKTGKKISGATVHIVDEDYDHGEILRQSMVPVDPSDTPESLAAKVLEVEHRLYPEVLRDIALGKISSVKIK